MIPPIKITVSIDENDPATVHRALGCTGNALACHTVWFAEAYAADSPLPLLSADLVLRLRSGHLGDDITVALRPEGDIIFAAQWRRPFDDGEFSYRVVGDWHGDRRGRLLASATNHHPRGWVTSAIEDGADPIGLLDARQRTFIVSCTASGFPIDRLHILGPTTTTTWRAHRAGGMALSVTRSHNANVDFIEASTLLRAWPDETGRQFNRRANERREQLYDVLSLAGLRTEDNRRSGVERVLTGLSAQSLTP